jgi:hypothetical protein
MLTNIAIFVAFIYVATVITWGHYLMIMALKRARNAGRLTIWARICALPFAIPALPIDVLYNWTVGTILFLDIPREFLFTTRVSRLNNRSDWRGRLAKKFCYNLLDPYDPAGRHCK